MGLLGGQVDQFLAVCVEDVGNLRQAATAAST